MKPGDVWNCMTVDYYGKKIWLCWNEHSLKVFDSMAFLEWININYQLNSECTVTKQKLWYTIGTHSKTNCKDKEWVS